MDKEGLELQKQWTESRELDKANNNLLYCVICLIVMLVIIQY